MTITLVTGANGFVGRQLIAELARRQVPVRALVREPSGGAMLGEQVELRVTGDLTEIDRFDEILSGVDTVMHLAARAHVTSDKGAVNEDLYRKHNEVLTWRLAEASAKANVRTFVLLSSIKVYGERDRGRAFVEHDEALPQDAYGRSKLAAERALIEATARSRIAAVIVRPPLIYGPGVRANFLRMMKLVDRQLPMPLAHVQNRRSMISTGNLVDLLCRCRDNPAAAAGVLLASDGEDLSTPELIRRLAMHMRRRCRLFGMPAALLGSGARILGFSAEWQRLSDSLTLDIATARSRLQWCPPFSVDDELRRTVDYYLQLQSRRAV